MYKRFLSKYFLILLFSVLVFSFSLIVKADTINNNDNNDLQLVKESPIAILFECSTGKVIYEKNAHTKHPPASMTKIMTMLLVLEAIDNKIIKWDSVLSASQNAVSMGGSQIFLEVGEKMTVEELFKALAIASANDAAVVLGEAVAGSLDEFVKKMNQKALDLGLKDTNFVNCNGLPDLNHYSTAYDIGILSCYLINKYGDSVLKYT